LNERRLTVQEAAGELGISTDAVRMRLQRGTLRKHRDGEGRVYVLLTGDESKPNVRPNGVASPLLEAKDDTIRILREQLAAEREANRENRRLLLAALERPVRELEAETEEDPPKQSEGPETGARRPERGYPWWRFWGR
jgi:excisionase family DNA binding protein